MLLNKSEAEAFLKREGEYEKKVMEAISGFDFDKPLYIQSLEVGEKVCQYMRTYGYSGNWFALKGASMDDLAIFSGNEGRVLKLVEIVYQCDVLEGTAKSIPTNWKWAGGGAGGGTQMFMPSKYTLSCVKIIGPVKHA